MKEQMNCQIARDLMPLVLDEVSSEESRQAVEEHISECAACAEVFADMKAETISKVPDKTMDIGFQTAMKKGAQRFRLWKAVAICLTALLLLGVICIAANPSAFYGIRGPVPVEWMQNAHLVRTRQGAVLLQFTPDTRYRHFFGASKLSGNQNEKSGPFEYRLSFSYPKIAAALGMDFNDDAFQQEYAYTDRYVLRLSNGDWVIAPFSGSNVDWFYQDGQISFLDVAELTNDDIQKLAGKGVPVDGNTGIVSLADPWPDSTVLMLEDGHKQKAIYKSGDFVPLCDDETQKKFDRLVEIYPYFFASPGEVTDGLQG